MQLTASQANFSIQALIIKCIGLAALYFIAGKVGLYLAVPPGFATVIWPPSGLSIGILILWGWRLWPGILVGSFILNCQISDAFSLDTGFILDKLFPAMMIAAGSTIQSISAYFLVKKFIGLPLALSHIKQIFKIFALCGPLACQIAATMGVGALYLSDVLGPEQIAQNWMTWWVGDCFGVLVFMPLVFISPLAKDKILWRGGKIGALPAIVVLALIVPLGFTFYSWKITSENLYNQANKSFYALASESEQALISKINSYNYALLGGRGFFEGSSHVSRDEWREYVDSLNISDNFTGINGLGYVTNVKENQLNNFLAEHKKDFADFSIHPALADAQKYIITYIEPLESNFAAIGLNLGFEENRREAVETSRDIGETTLTKKIILVQDQQKSSGFLLLQPYYKKGMPHETQEEKRNAIEGWVYAPLVASNFLKDLTPAQGDTLNIRIYDQGQESAENLIYESASKQDDAVSKPYTVRKSINVLGQKWLIIWESTYAFEQSQKNSAPLYILVGGLLFTALFAIFMLINSIKDKEAVEWVSKDGKIALPLSIFIVMLMGFLYLYNDLNAQELNSVKSLVDNEAGKIEQIITLQANQQISAIQRLGLRWNAANGTPQDQWEKDTKNYINQLSGLKVLEWVDSTFHVRWVQPYSGNESIIGLDVRFDDERKELLKKAQNTNGFFVTPPFKLKQGYQGFIIYVPVAKDKKPDGFIAGIISADLFVDTVLNSETLNNFTLDFSYEGAKILKRAPQGQKEAAWHFTRNVAINDRIWTLKLTPTEKFVSAHLTNLPIIILLGGILISALVSLVTHYILVARLRAQILQQSNILNNSILSSANSLMIATDPNGIVLQINKQAERLLGIENEDVVNKIIPKHWLNKEEFLERQRVLSEELGRNIQPNFEVLSSKAKLYGLDVNEWTFVHADGQSFPVRLSVTSMNDIDGNIVGYLGVGEDITEVKKQQQELQAREAQMRLLIENTPAAIAMFDENMCYITTSKRWLKDYKLEEKLIIGKSHYEIFPEILKNTEWLDHHQRALKGEVFDTHEENWVRADGKQEWITWSLHPWYKSPGIVGGIIMFTEVITERKTAELALAKSEDTFRSAMEFASIGMALVSTEGRWLKVNKALSDMLGYSEQELLKTDFQTITHQEDIDTDLEYVEKMLSNEISFYEMEKRYIHSDGHTIWANLSVSLARNEDNTPRYFIAQIQDISERKEIERIKAEFISMVSHELRTPLTSIRGSLGLIEGTMAKDLPPKAAKLITLAHKNSERLILLINDILDMEKIASNKMRFDMQWENLGDIVRGSVEANQAYADKFKVSYLVENIQDEIFVNVDEQRLAQVLTNLLSNAAKFSAENSTVTISVETHDGNVRVSVKDTGSGIPEEFRSRIFEKFSQADSSATRQKGGTGLGLHISKQLMEHMSGDIGFESTMGEGTTFWFSLPVQQNGKKIMFYQDGIFGAEDGIHTSEDKDAGIPKILHIEDDHDFINLLSSSLQGKAEVVSANTIGQAITALEKHHYSLIILDLGFPDGSGLDLLERMPSLYERETPVIIISATEVSADVKSKVLTAMVKSKVPESHIIDAILSAISKE